MRRIIFSKNLLFYDSLYCQRNCKLWVIENQHTHFKVCLHIILGSLFCWKCFYPFTLLVKCHINNDESSRRKMKYGSSHEYHFCISKVFKIQTKCLNFEKSKIEEKWLDGVYANIIRFFPIFFFIFRKLFSWFLIISGFARSARKIGIMRHLGVFFMHNVSDEIKSEFLNPYQGFPFIH